jgi:hypothetical protein
MQHAAQSALTPLCYNSACLQASLALCCGDTATLVVLIAARTSFATGSSADGTGPCLLADGSNANPPLQPMQVQMILATTAPSCFKKEYCLCRACQHVTCLVKRLAYHRRMTRIEIGKDNGVLVRVAY